MEEGKKKYRLVTRSDMDGLVCAVLLKELDLISDIKFVHPKDVQDGKIEITPNDITTNLPYVEKAHLVFDHHASEIERVGKIGPIISLYPTHHHPQELYMNIMAGRLLFQILQKK
jgi:hypothetical protein